MASRRPTSSPTPSSIVPENVIPAIPILVGNGSLSRVQAEVWCLASGYSYNSGQNTVSHTGERLADEEIGRRFERPELLIPGIVAAARDEIRRFVFSGGLAQAKVSPKSRALPSIPALLNSSPGMKNPETPESEWLLVIDKEKAKYLMVLNEKQIEAHMKFMIRLLVGLAARREVKIPRGKFAAKTGLIQRLRVILKSHGLNNKLQISEEGRDLLFKYEDDFEPFTVGQVATLFGEPPGMMIRAIESILEARSIPFSWR